MKMKVIMEKKDEELARASSQLVTCLKGNVERACVMHEKLQEDSVHTEVMHETLVDNLKDDLCRATRNSQDEHCLEVEDTKKNIDTFFWILKKNVLKEERKQAKGKMFMK